MQRGCMASSATGIAMASISTESRANVARLAEGLWVGFIVGTLYLAARVFTHGLSDQYFTPVAARQFLKLNFAEATRSIAPLTPLFCPALLCVLNSVRKPWHSLLVELD